MTHLKCEGNFNDEHVHYVIPVVLQGGLKLNLCENCIYFAKKQGVKITRETSIITQFKIMLKKHDWFYMMSDDFNVWNRGKEEHDKIEKHFKTYSFLYEIYIKKRSKIFKNASQ